MQARCSRVTMWLIQAIWFTIRLVRAGLDISRRVRVLWIRPKHMINGVTFGVMVVVVRRRYVSPAKERENSSANE